jgi:hypothetical protein
MSMRQNSGRRSSSKRCSSGKFPEKLAAGRQSLDNGQHERVRPWCVDSPYLSRRSRMLTHSAGKEDNADWTLQRRAIKFAKTSFSLLDCLRHPRRTSRRPKLKCKPLKSPPMEFGKRHASVNARRLTYSRRSKPLVNARVTLATAQHDRIVGSYTLLANVGRLSPVVLGLPVDPNLRTTSALHAGARRVGWYSESGRAIAARQNRERRR